MGLVLGMGMRWVGGALGMGMWLKLGLGPVMGWSWDVVGIGEEVGAQSSGS